MKIRSRITLWITLTGWISTLALSVFVFVELIGEPHELLDEDLVNNAASFAENLDYLRALDQKHKHSTPYWVRIADSKGRILYESELARKVSLPSLSREQFSTLATDIPLKHFSNNSNDDESTSFRILFKSFSEDGSCFTVQIARPIESPNDDLIELATVLTLGLGTSTLLLIGAGYFVSGQILRPINNIIASTKEINEKSLNERIHIDKNNDEVTELSITLNEMFDRLQSSFYKQREFIANASHELKTPVTLLRLSISDILCEQKLPEDYHGKIVILNRIILRLDRLIKQLLSLTSLDMVNQLNYERFILNDVVESVVEDYKIVMDKGRIHFENVTDQQILILADKDKIKRVFINLIENSVKYNCEEGVIRLHMKSDEKNEKTFISLWNTTEQNVSEIDNRVFEQFYRVEKSRSTAFGGVGLGLSIVKKIVDLHGGTISVNKQAENMIEFRIAIPMQ